jgi:hypothetical protein
MNQENVRGAQPWVGRAQWHFGSYYLWGDVPALMPHRFQATKGSRAAWFNDHKGQSAPVDRATLLSMSGSRSPARKAASARIAKIPFSLAQYIARVYHPDNLRERSA